MLFSTMLVSYPQTTEYFVHIPPSDGIDCPRAVSQSLQLCTVNSLSTLELYCPQAVQRCTSLLHNEDIALSQYILHCFYTSACNTWHGYFSSVTVLSFVIFIFFIFLPCLPFFLSFFFLLYFSLFFFPFKFFCQSQELFLSLCYHC